MIARGHGLALLPGIVLLVSWTPGPVLAQQAAEASVDFDALREDRQKKAGLYVVGNRISRYLSAAAEAVDAEDPEEAKRLLLKLRPNRLNPYQRALVHRMLAFVAYGAEQPRESIGYFEKVLAEEVLPLRDEARIRFNIAQLYLGLQEWSEAVRWLDLWFANTENPDPLGHYLKGIAQYQMQDFEAAIVSAKKAVEQSPEPNESWLRLLSALYAQQEDFESATPVLEELVLRFPKPQYWVQLALIYGAREDFQRSLAVQQVAYAQGFMTEDKDLRRLARSYLFNDLPFPAAQVLERGLEEGRIERDPDSLEMLANSWIAAREYDRSLAPLQEAAELSENGKLDVRLGQVYMQREEWGQAVERFRTAVEKGGLEEPGNAELLLGISYYNDGRVAPARSSFVRARQHDATREEADRWITHLKNGSEAG